MPYRHLLVPTDGSDLSLAAVQQAVDLARPLGARLTVFHVQSNFPISLVGVGELVDPHTVEALVAAGRHDAERILAAAAAVAEAAGVACDRDTVVHALPYAAIVEAAGRHGADLIVMASHGRRGLEGILLGSETHRVLTHSPCPVLVVR
ncbi:MAG: universal stress protein [Cyanobacteriota bacterium]|nr:universal stress protein [Cyanobacteriota bacterium]